MTEEARLTLLVVGVAICLVVLAVSRVAVRFIKWREARNRPVRAVHRARR
jgi:hypothetical protein